jgi:hypothetical protein
VQDGGLDPENERAANVGAQKMTDAGGRVVFNLWPIGEYRLGASLYLPDNRYSSDMIDVPPGTTPFRGGLALKGLHLRKGK